MSILREFFIFILVCGTVFSCVSNGLEQVEVTTGYSVEVYSIDADSIRQGMYLERSLDGKDTISVANYKNGKLEGERKIFENGRLSTMENYKDGVYHGPEYTYYPNGDLYTKGNYTDGVIDPLFYVYYEGGVLKEKVTMEDNTENGPFEQYYETGELQWVGSFIDGANEVGLLMEYDKAGEIIKKMDCGKYRGEYICQTIWERGVGDVVAKLEYED